MPVPEPLVQLEKGCCDTFERPSRLCEMSRPDKHDCFVNHPSSLPRLGLGTRCPACAMRRPVRKGQLPPGGKAIHEAWWI